MPNNGYFLMQIDRLQSSIIRMGNYAGRMVGEAVAALVARDVDLAREVLAKDEELDRQEDAHEEQTIQIIALNQPVARDLRLLVAFLRVNTTVERVGDLAVNVAKTVIRLEDKPNLKTFVDIPTCYELVRQMWDDSMLAFQEQDEALAQTLRDRDDKVDQLNEEIISQLIQIGTEDPSQLFQATNVLGVSKTLERIADLAVDVADEVVYARKGELRHARTHHRHTA